MVDTESYNPSDPDVKSQITTLSQSGADTALLAASALKCAQALNAIQETGWQPTSYISGTCTSKTVVGLANPGANNGVLSSIYLKDPVDPEWANDQAVQQLKQLGPQYGLSDSDLTDGIVSYGWSMGQLMVETLKRSPELTRQSVMETAYSLQNVDLPLLLPGITVNTNGTTDPFPIEQLQIGQYNGQYWQLQGNVISFEGQDERVRRRLTPRRRQVRGRPAFGPALPRSGYNGGMHYDCVTVEREGSFTRVTMNRPERRNALSQQHLEELLAAFRSIGETDALGVVLAGNGPVFSAGHDFGDLAGADLDTVRAHAVDLYRADADDADDPAGRGGAGPRPRDGSGVPAGGDGRPGGGGRVGRRSPHPEARAVGSARPRWSRSGGPCRRSTRWSWRSPATRSTQPRPLRGGW